MEKKKISAEIIADSKNESGQRITTFILTFPRIILAELNTHRMFSRNSASSRAIPFTKMLERVKEDPFIPIAWQKDHKGMQGTEYFYGEQATDCELEWVAARDWAVDCAKRLNSTGATKQLCNRLLEPFMWHTAIVTATEFENFFKLRCPQYEFSGQTYRSKKDCMSANKYLETTHTMMEDQSTIQWLKMNKGQGEIHIMELAEQMWDAMNNAVPKELKSGEWHIPFGNNLDMERILNIAGEHFGKEDEKYVDNLCIKIATARCARVSYMNFEGKDDYDADIKLHDILSTSGHWSPFEHCAKAMNKDEYDSSFHKGFEGDGPDFYTNGWSGNFRGFIQYRKLFLTENGK